MKKFWGIMAVICLSVLPGAAHAQVETIAGSMQIGVHFDLDYRWSGESQKNPSGGEIHWNGYDSITGQNFFVELKGKVGDHVSYKVLEGLVTENWVGSFDGTNMDIHVEPEVLAAPMESWMEFRVVDQLNFKVGKMVPPTLFANTGVHEASVVHTANQPLIASPILGFNEMLVAYYTEGFFQRVPLPTELTGLATLVSFAGFEINWTIFYNWLLPPVMGLGPVGWGDAGFDFNKQKGNLGAITYRGKVGPGKLSARIFYYGEIVSLGHEYLQKVNNEGWGAGVLYEAKYFFIDGEYANSDLHYKHDPIHSIINNAENDWWGYYATVGGRFKGFELLYRLDYIKYTDLSTKSASIPLQMQTIDDEMWHTIGLNYLVNNNATVGVNYVIKRPEKGIGHLGGASEKQPNIDELLIMTEVDTL